MAPITWRNVDAPNIGDPTRTLSLAQNSFNLAFEGLQKPIQQMQATEDANWATGKANNTREVLNTLAGFKTPEEAQAALNGGVVQNMLARMGAQVDSDRVLAAQRNLIPELQQRFVQGEAYKNAKETASESDLVGALDSLLANPKDRKNIKGAADAYIQAGMLRPGTAAAILDKARLLDRQDEEMGLRREANDIQRQHLSLQRQDRQDRLNQIKSTDIVQAGAANEAAIRTALAVADDRLKKNVLTGTDVNDQKGRDLITAALRETGTSMFSFAKPETMWEAVKKLDANKQEAYRLFGPEGNQIRVPVRDANGKLVVDKKTGIPDTVLIPLSAERVVEAIKRDKGGSWSDPTPDSIYSSLRHMMDDSLMRTANSQYADTTAARNDLLRQLAEIQQTTSNRLNEKVLGSPK